MIIWIDGTYGVGKTAVAMRLKEKFLDDNIELDEIGSNLSMHDQLRFSTYGELRDGLLEKIKDRFSLEE